ncbi:radical SAM/SPASM domain protein, ACGX system [uncultured Thomasclavelia sp.]|uniref:radical SAM/SPASM domain protein, ACGX system n=1 Tax=uncultured Thomasclavelia sp. TaxID=3025759 RepID=UPI0025DAB86E|nr:radical SAM/SPASM domain protein, ACGX system [uncultured Thomasclavelia sp.]
MKEYFAYQWHITDYCDQRCKHCYIFSENQDIELLETPYDQVVATLNDIEIMCQKDGKIPYIYLTGGDPILHTRFWDIMNLFKKHQIAFTILGNPFHLNDEICRRLKAVGCLKYQLSLDGLKETHDYFRKPGSFDWTLEKIKCLKKAGIKVAIMTTVSGTNIHEIPDLIDLVVENKVDIFAFGRYCPTSLEKSTHIEPLEYRQFLDICWKKFEQNQNTQTSFNLKDHLWTLYLYEKGLLEIPENLDANTIYDGCHCGSHHMTILPDGKIYSCRRMESEVGNIKDKSLYEWFHDQKYDQYRQYHKFEKCQKCELLRFCRGCPAVSYGYSHNMYAPDPQCWKEV